MMPVVCVSGAAIFSSLRGRNVAGRLLSTRLFSGAFCCAKLETKRLNKLHDLERDQA